MTASADARRSPIMKRSDSSNPLILPPPRFAGDFVADYAVNRAHEVADHIGPLGAGWREPQIAAVGNSPFLRQNGWLGSFPAVDQRADGLWQGPLLGRGA